MINLKVMSLISKYFASTDETRYYLNGVFVEYKDGEVIMTATDGYKFVTFKQHYVGDCFESFIMPSAYLKGLKFKAKEEGFADFSIKDNQVTITYNDVSTTVHTIDGNFPQYRSLIPQPGYDIVPAHYNAKYLNDLALFAKQMEFKQSTIAQNGRDAAFVDFGVDYCFGLIMPIRGADARNDFNAF